MNKKDLWLVSIGLIIVLGLLVFVFAETFSNQTKPLHTSEFQAEKSTHSKGSDSRKHLVAGNPSESNKGPFCFKSEIDKATRSMDALKRDKSAKYTFYRRLFGEAKTSESELVARLVYAETLAGRCHPSLHQELYQMIFYVIKNRVIKKGGIVEAVVWQFNQFASSLHNYKGSMISEFLCPTQDELWRKVLSFVEDNIEINNGSEGLPVPKDGYNYFLFQHNSEPVQFSKGHWATIFPVFKELKFDGKVCARFYRNRHYR